MILNPCDHLNEFGLSVSLHACNAQYLACPAFQADISEYGAALLFKADILKTQLDGAGPIVGNPLYIKGYGSAYHELSQLVFCGLGSRKGGDVLSPAEYGDVIRNGQGLLKLVGNNDDGPAVLL